MATNVFAGRAGDLRVAATSSGTGVTLGKMRNWSVDVTGDVVDVTNFDSGGWRESLDGVKGWTISAESLMCGSTIAASVSQDELRTALSSGTRQCFWAYDSTATGSHIFWGNGYVAGWTLGGELEGAVMHGFSITGDGTLTETT